MSPLNRRQEEENKEAGDLTLITLRSCVSCHTLAAEGAPLAVAAAAAAAGRGAHVDTAAVGGQAAGRAGLGFSRVPQIIQLTGGDREETLRGSKEPPLNAASIFCWKENRFLLLSFIPPV